jgi:hypothetical protein
VNNNDSREMRTAQLLWDVAGAADPHINRNLLAYLHLLPLSEDEIRTLAADLLHAFERLGQQRPDVVLPFLGQLLNEAEET